MYAYAFDGRTGNIQFFDRRGILKTEVTETAQEDVCDEPEDYGYEGSGH